MEFEGFQRIDQVSDPASPFAVRFTGTYGMRRFLFTPDRFVAVHPAYPTG